MVAVLAFIGTLLLLVLVHEWGHFKAARLLGVTVEEFGFGFPPAIASKKVGETVYSLNWLPLGGFVRIKGEEGDSRDFDSFGQQSILRRATIVAAGVFMNLVLAVVLFTITLSVGMRAELDRELSQSARVRDVEHEVLGVIENSPATGVLRDGDKILAVNGNVFLNRADLQSYLRGHAGEEARLLVERQGATETITLIPREFTASSGDSVVGVGVQLLTTGTVSYPVYLAPIEAIKLSARTLWLIVSSLGTMIWQLVTLNTVGLEVAGPIGIAVITGEVASAGLIFFIQFVAILSLNLALVNVLPIPALDGGRLLFLAIEAIRRRPVSQKLESTIHRFGFVFLLGLVLLVTVSDINRFGGVFTGWWAQVFG